MSKKLPKRAGSRATYVFWLIFAVIVCTWGMLQLIRPEGDVFWGLVAIVGMFAMVTRETKLRAEWKRQQRGGSI